MAKYQILIQWEVEASSEEDAEKRARNGMATMRDCLILSEEDVKELGPLMPRDEGAFHMLRLPLGIMNATE